MVSSVVILALGLAVTCAHAQKPADPDQDQCSVPLASQVDCGHVGTQQADCEKKGCCWQPKPQESGEESGEPWCFYPSSPKDKGYYGKGFVRGARNEFVGTLTITQADRDNAQSSIDWSGFATSAVKNQGVCGSCWAYSATEGIETAVFFHNNEQGSVPDYSEQQIISCDTLNGGCNGGDPMGALNYYTSAGGIDSQSDYPDSSENSGDTGSCTWDGNKAFSGSLNWWYAVQNGVGDNQDEEGLAAAVSKYGPMSICLNANWDNYADWTTDGVYYGLNGECPNDHSDHCVQLVGYDKTASTPYWKIRNSWGSVWGESGYIRIPYGRNNYCGVANEAYLINVGSGLQAPKPIGRNTTANVIV